VLPSFPDLTSNENPSFLAIEWSMADETVLLNMYTPEWSSWSGCCVEYLCQAHQPNSAPEDKHHLYFLKNFIASAVINVEPRQSNSKLKFETRVEVIQNKELFFRRWVCICAMNVGRMDIEVTCSKNWSGRNTKNTAHHLTRFLFFRHFNAIYLYGTTSLLQNFRLEICSNSTGFVYVHKTLWQTI